VQTRPLLAPDAGLQALPAVRDGTCSAALLGRSEVELLLAGANMSLLVQAFFNTLCNPDSKLMQISTLSFLT